MFAKPLGQNLSKANFKTRSHAGRGLETNMGSVRSSEQSPGFRFVAMRAQCPASSSDVRAWNLGIAMIIFP
jgi:hypothetical protein